MTTRGPLLVHIGYHKTGSSWLQRGLFGSAPFVHACGRRDITDDFAPIDPFSYDQRRVAAKYASLRDKASIGGTVAVVSHERLSGNPHSGGYDSRTIADRLAATFADARVLIVIREQSTMLESIYKQYVRKGGPMSLAQYITPPTHGHHRMPRFRTGYLEYDHLIAYYHEVFDPGAVLVLTYEQLTAVPSEFVSAIGQHVGREVPRVEVNSSVNASGSALGTTLKRWANRFLVRDTLNPAGLVDAKDLNVPLERAAERIVRRMPVASRRRAELRLKDNIATVIGRRYATSNRTTARLSGIDLRALGYEVAEA